MRPALPDPVVPAAGQGGERLGELGHACGVPPPHRHPPAATLGARMSCAQHPATASGSGCIFHSLFIELEISAARGDPGRGGGPERGGGKREQRHGLAVPWAPFPLAG